MISASVEVLGTFFKVDSDVGFTLGFAMPTAPTVAIFSVSRLGKTLLCIVLGYADIGLLVQFLQGSLLLSLHRHSGFSATFFLVT